MYIVVMDYMDEPLKDKKCTTQIQVAIEMLHSQGYVHGDL